MGSGRLVLRGLTYYWRTYAAVILGVATAVAVLAGALLVGDSVRGSLRALVLQRLGQTDAAVVSAGFFREALANQLANARTADASFRDVCPLVMLDALVTDQTSGREAHQVRVYGVDDRFWRFHGVTAQGPADRDALVSPALAARIGAEVGHAILVRVQRPSAVPLESLQGRKDDLGRTLRLDVRAVVPGSDMGEFSLDPKQGEMRAVFVPLSRLQQELELEGQVNVLLVSGQSDPGRIEQLVRSTAAIEDVGLTVRALSEPNAISVGSDAGLLTAAQELVATQTLAQDGLKGQPSFTYLANSLRLAERSIPYSLVTAMDLQTLGVDGGAKSSSDSIVLNEWAATELRARTGDVVTMEYYVWEDPGQLVTRTADFHVAGVVPIAAADRDLAPVLPGISDSPSLADWDPPFPVDLRRVRPVDEAYWDRYRTTPKAFVPLAAGQRLWRSRYGAITAIRVPAPRGAANERVMSLQALRDKYATDLRSAMDPLAMGLAVRSVKAEGLAASAGATDFGEYFTYFSFFLVVSALLLAALFFKLGVEQRVREVGLLRAVGFSPAAVRRLFIGEGLIVAVIGSAIGAAGAVGYASLITFALRTWWVDAVSTTAITLHVTPASLIVGVLGGVVSAVACIWWTLRGLARVSERSLLAGELGEGQAFRLSATPSRARSGYAAGALAALGAALLAAGATGALDATGAFFGAGSALLGASLCTCAVVLRRPGKSLGGHGWVPLSRLGFRNTTFRPGRSVLSIAVIASATFILISVDAFRRGGTASPADPHGGGGGYPLIVESLVPIGRDPNTPEGREAMNLFDLDPSVRFEPFRVRPGDDASCLNLYEPRNPKIIAPTDAFLAAGRFSFQSSLAETDAETANPWLLLHKVSDRSQTGVRHLSDTGSVIPVIADANSMTYVLHKKLGEDIVIPHRGGELRLRLVAALSDSIFQGELLMSQENFREFFPEQEGYRLFLVDAPQDRAAAVAADLEDAMSDVGAEVTGTAERLAAFHKVENTYLSTFQTLGGLGLLLGTVGLATVVLRNVLERRRELALLAAVGYRRRHFLLMIVAENVALLTAGLTAGAVCAGLAILPAVAERGGRVPLTAGGGLLLLAVFITGLLSSVVATRAAISGPLLASLRSE